MVGRRDGLDDGLEYNVSSITPVLTTEQLALLGGLSDNDREALPTQVKTVPESLPREVRDRVAAITANIDSPYLKAKAINDYFTDDTQRLQVLAEHGRPAPATTSWSTS